MQGAKKIIFIARHLGKLKLTFTNPDVISTSPKSFLRSRINLPLLLLFEFLKNITCLSGKLKTEFTSPKAKSSSPALSDTTFFARCKCLSLCILNGRDWVWYMKSVMLNWVLKVFSIKGPIENTYMFTSPTLDRPPYFAWSSKGTKRPSCLQGKGATFISLVHLWESIPWPLVLQSSFLPTELILPRDNGLKQPFKC